MSKKPKSSTELWTKIRRDWGAVNPVTKVIPDKRRKPSKHKKKENEYYDVER